MCREDPGWRRSKPYPIVLSSEDCYEINFVN